MWASTSALLNVTPHKSLSGNKYTKSHLSFFVEEGYLYVSTPMSKLQFIRIVGLFEDPIEVKQFENFCEDCTECKECIDYELEEFPIDNDMIDPMIELTIQELVILFGQAQQDLTNDSNDDVVNNRRRQ